MSLRRPTLEDMHWAAARNGLTLTDEEAEAYISLAYSMFASLDALDQLPLESPRLDGAVRDPGSRPHPDEDPYNAVLRRCRVKARNTGKLAGVRVGVKDSVSVAGMPLTCGSRVMSGYVPEIDATVITRLLSEGAEIVAVLNMDDFAWSGMGDSSAYGPVLNPHNPEHLASGSSGGSAAALYYDYIDVTLGGDQGGSIRMPAAWCGVVGLKPTFGLVPYTGILSGEFTYDHIGPLARTAEMAALLQEVISGKDPLDPRQGGEVPVQEYSKQLDGNVKGLKIGVVKEGFGLPMSEEEVDAAVRRGLTEMEKVGMKVSEISIPAHRTAMAIYRGIGVEGGAFLMRNRGLGFGWQGFYDIGFAETIGRAMKAQADDLPPELKLTMLMGTYLTDYYHGRIYAKGQNLRPRLRAAYDTVLEEYDVLAMPTVPFRALKHIPDIDWKTRVSRGIGLSDNCSPFDATGHPAISIPCGKPDGLPVGLMLVGKHFQDGLLLKIADAFEKAVEWEQV